ADTAPFATEPALNPAGPEFLFGGRERGGRWLEDAVGRLPAHEHHVDARNLVVAELDVTHAAPVVLRTAGRASPDRGDAIGRRVPRTRAAAPSTRTATGGWVRAWASRVRPPSVRAVRAWPGDRASAAPSRWAPAGT